MDYREAAEYLKSRDDYLILTHKRPDGDTIGSAVGLCELLRAMGKTAWLLESRDAGILFRDLLEGHIAPEGFRPAVVVSVDVASKRLLPDNAQPYKDRIDLAIDHHPSNEGIAALTCLEADKAACGEIIWKMCEYMDIIMDPAIAAPLYVAIATDTGCFCYGNTTPHTHRVAAALMDQDIPYQAMNKRFFRTKSMQRLKLESLMLEGLKLHYDGTLAVACVTHEMMARAGATEDDMDDLSAFCGQIEGVINSVTIKETEGDEYKISVRTDPDKLNATAVCARLGGGGHKAASGCSVYGTMAEAEAAILAAIAAELEDRSDG